MPYDLACLSSGGTYAHPISDVVKTTFQQLQQVFASDTFLTICFGIIGSELTFQYAKNPTQFLLLAQLNAIVRQALISTLAMLTWREITLFNRTFVCKAFFALQEELFTLTATLTAFGVKISSQSILLNFLLTWAI
jgi:hypothetical protein